MFQCPRCCHTQRKYSLSMDTPTLVVRQRHNPDIIARHNERRKLNVALGKNHVAKREPFDLVIRSKDERAVSAWLTLFTSHFQRLRYALRYRWLSVCRWMTLCRHGEYVFRVTNPVLSSWVGRSRHGSSSNSRSTRDQTNAGTSLASFVTHP